MDYVWTRTRQTAVYRAEKLVDAGEPRAVADQGGGDGAFVFAVSPRLTKALAHAERDRLCEVAALWIGLRAEEGEHFTPEIADAILGDLADLVRRARRQGQSVYCWVG
ncbi:hypothetical protein [Streptomyces sp. NPDC056600]|uniref:hypothetical protein n=1 Tax=Streptomyces sp. NPDC056600 TaxID=3345874 RepID=UPI0036894D9D